MRAAFIRAMCDLAKKDDRIFLITGDLGYRFLEKFADQFPDRFLNIGVAEANLITVAAGLSTTGFIPFVYSIATFASMRAFEQIRNDVSLQNLNVKIVGIGAGLAYTKAGPTHHSMEDIALMRTLPNMTIVAPADPQESYGATIALGKHRGPCYLRLERNPDILVHAHTPKFVIGKGTVIQKGQTQASRSLALIATGTKVSVALEVAAVLSKRNIIPTVVAMPTIQPLDTALLKKICSTHRIIASIEEHRVSGGLGSAVGEFILGTRVRPSRLWSPKLLKFGLKDEFTPISAEYSYLVDYHHMTVQHILTELVKKLRH